jgi:rhamnosyltransferase
MITKFSSTTDFSKTYIQTAQAISSGSFIVSNSLKSIGLMNEKLFIDYVDFEWCWRATAMGYKIFTISDLVIRHTLGDESKKIFCRKITVRKNTRYYYMIRNGSYLARYSPFLKWHERFFLFSRIIIHIAGVIFLKHNLQIIALVALATYDGLSGKMHRLI